MTPEYTLTSWKRLVAVTSHQTLFKDLLIEYFLTCGKNFLRLRTKYNSSYFW